MIERLDEQSSRVDRLSDGGEVPIHDRLVDGAFGPSGILGVDLGWRQVQDDGDRGDPGRLGSLQQASAVWGPDVRGVDHGRPSRREPAREHPMKDVKGARRCGLVRGITGDRRTQRVGGENLVRGEQAGRQRRLSGACRTDQHHQARIWQDEHGHGQMMNRTRVR